MKCEKKTLKNATKINYDDQTLSKLNIKLEFLFVFLAPLYVQRYDWLMLEQRVTQTNDLQMNLCSMLDFVCARASAFGMLFQQ